MARQVPFHKSVVLLQQGISHLRDRRARQERPALALLGRERLEQLLDVARGKPPGVHLDDHLLQCRRGLLDQRPEPAGEVLTPAHLRHLDTDGSFAGLHPPGLVTIAITRRRFLLAALIGLPAQRVGDLTLKKFFDHHLAGPAQRPLQRRTLLAL
jgi:hypothetical protein